MLNDIKLISLTKSMCMPCGHRLRRIYKRLLLLSIKKELNYVNLSMESTHEFVIKLSKHNALNDANIDITFKQGPYNVIVC